jgi:CHAT domain-containing protein
LIKLLADKQQFSSDRYWQEARGLAQQLIGPARNQLAGKTQLVIVADGALQRLPFEALLKETAAPQPTTALNEWPYLIKEFAISYAPSVSIWANLHVGAQQGHTGQKDFIAFGDPLYDQASSDLSATLSETTRAGAPGHLPPLTHSRAEVEKIAALFPRKRVALFLGAQANEENVKAAERLSQYRFVHFSAHAIMNETAPRFSGLLLSPFTATDDAPHTTSYEDGLLTANEIFKLRLNAELVSLSACETGLGKEIKGEGLMGLMRAFICAGTPSVLVSLWKVDDEAAADQMVRFYQSLLKGRAQGRFNKAQALRQARLNTIRRGSVPYFWAPFVLVGNS